MLPHKSHSTPTFARAQFPHEPTLGSELRQFHSAIERCLDLVVTVGDTKNSARGDASASRLRDLDDAIAKANAFVDAADAVCAARCDSGVVEFEGITAESACAAVIKLAEQFLSVLKAAGTVGRNARRLNKVTLEQVERLRAFVRQEVTKAAREYQQVLTAPLGSGDHPGNEPHQQDLPPWNEISADLANLPSRLLDYLWHHGRSKVEDVTAHVWTPDKAVSSGALKGLLNRTNQLLVEAEINAQVRSKNGSIYLDRGFK